MAELHDDPSIAGRPPSVPPSSERPRVTVICDLPLAADDPRPNGFRPRYRRLIAALASRFPTVLVTFEESKGKRDRFELMADDLPGDVRVGQSRRELPASRVAPRCREANANRPPSLGETVGAVGR